MIAAGDPDAFARWVAGAEASLRASLRGFAAQVDTEAVLQETLLRVWQIAPRCEPDGKPNGLLRVALRIARNLAIDQLRRRQPDALEPEDVERVPGGPPPEARASDPFLRRAIQECLRRLPARPGQALRARLRSGGGDPDATLAARLGMKLNTFLQNVTRARRHLAECLRRKGVDLELETS